MKKTIQVLIILIIVTIVACTNTGTQKNTTSENKKILLLTSRIKENPQKASLFFERGNEYKLQNEDSLAILDFIEAANIDSTNETYLLATSDILYEHKDIRNSLTWLKKVIALNPTDINNRLKCAKLNLYIEDYPNAFSEINTVLKMDVYNADAYYIKGMCYKNMKDTNRAISSFQTAVQTNIKHVDALMQLGILYADVYNPLALQYYENAFRADTTNLEPLYGQGMFFQNQKKWEPAKKVFKRCILLNREFYKAYYNTGWIFLQQDSTEKALRQFEIAIQIKPDYYEAYYNKGLCNEILGNYKKAEADYKQTLSFNPDYEIAKAALQRVVSK